MLAVPNTTYAINVAPFASLGRQTVGEESADLKHSSFKPAEQLDRAARTQHERSPDERRNDQVEADRLTRQRQQGNHLLGESALRSDNLSRAYGLNALMAKRLPDTTKNPDTQEAEADTRVDEEASVFISVDEVREAKRQEEARRFREEIMALVSRRSIQLNQRLIEIALAPDELSVGEIISQRV